MYQRPQFSGKTKDYLKSGLSESVIKRWKANRICGYRQHSVGQDAHKTLEDLDDQFWEEKKKMNAEAFEKFRVELKAELQTEHDERFERFASLCKTIAADDLRQLKIIVDTALDD